MLTRRVSAVTLTRLEQRRAGAQSVAGRAAHRLRRCRSTVDDGLVRNDNFARGALLRVDRLPNCDAIPDFCRHREIVSAVCPCHLTDDLIRALIVSEDRRATLHDPGDPHVPVFVRRRNVGATGWWQRKRWAQASTRGERDCKRQEKPSAPSRQHRARLHSHLSLHGRRLQRALESCPGFRELPYPRRPIEKCLSAFTSLFC